MSGAGVGADAFTGSKQAATAVMAVITRVEPAAGDEPPPYTW